MNKISFVILALLAVAGVAHAWHCTGHMLTAEIAGRAAPDAAKHFAPLVTYWATKYERIDTMTQAACWPDDFRSQNHSMDEWHFHDGCYSVDGTACPTPRGLLYEILPQAVQFLSDNSTSQDVQAFYLMYLLHLTGDIHQPLHTASQVSSAFPQGDRGGNEFFVHYMHRTKENLHSYADCVGELYDKDPPRPFSENPDSQSFIENTAAALMQNYTFPESQTSFDGNFSAWGAESFGLAVSGMYLNGKLKTSSTLTSTYIDNTRQMLQSQVVLGGLRLGSVLNYIYEGLKSGGRKPSPHGHHTRKPVHHHTKKPSHHKN